MRASDRAYSILRGDILDWSLRPGAVLAEVEQSLRLGISRTPVREALARLAADGLVEPLGGRGLVVTPVSDANVVELFELRSALERQAAVLAASRRDVDVFVALRDALSRSPELLAQGEPGRRDYYALVHRFDDAIDSSVANAYLVAALAGVRTHVARLRRLSHDKPERLIEATREHLLIVDAIIAGDAQLAGDATAVHLHNSLRSILLSAAERDAFDRDIRPRQKETR
ncbi:MAG: hypothetical protein JWP75_3413 [Frondihabitans sp.]|nr:hypothetical protein [Frondihabitans sp.]